MPIPAPIRLIRYLIASWRFPVIGIGCAVFFPLILLFYLAGVLSPTQPTFDWATPMQLIGLFLVLAILPAYLLMCLTAWVRGSESMFRDILPLLEKGEVDGISRYQYGRYWPVGALIGLLYAITFNIGWGALSFDPNEPIFLASVTMVLGQFVMWPTIGVVLFLIIHEDLILHHHGRFVRISLYDLNSLNGFGSAAINGLLMVVGALTLSVLQSLDREFRVEQYINGMYVAIPAAIVLVLLPIWAVHKRIKAAKLEELERINREIQQASTELQADALLHLNGLLQRRVQIQGLRTWPMDLSLFARFILYVLIPPLAWAGAAVTELFLDSFLAG